mmetsp:Transcript_13824/g.32290  ORF Transcript_13824/g.32290 Transcript_13824/m.32290 type:complete len:253 (+) Transcript_13824:273-1031(+)
MSQRNLFPNLRSPLAKSDEYGVTELLREVSQRNTSLTDEERKEVGEIVKRVEQHNKAKSSPMAIMKKKLSEMNVVNDMSSANHTLTKLEDKDVTEDIDEEIVGDIAQSDAEIEARSSVKKFAKDFFRKFSTDETGDQNDQAASKPEENRGIDLFRNFSKGMQQHTSSNTEEDTRPEILKAFEESSQSGRDLFRNLSKKIQTPLSSPMQKASSPSTSETAAAVSESFRAIEQIQYSNMLDLSDDEETIVFSSN